MIQRIQSLYLLLVVAIYTLLFFVPIYRGEAPQAPNGAAVHSIEFQNQASFIEKLPQANNTITENKLMGLHTMMLTILAGLLIAGCVLAVLQYKNRDLQLKLTRALTGLSFVYLIIMVISLMHSRGMIPDIKDHFLAGVYMMVVTPILLILAGRAILKDIKLVRSTDRLR